MSSLYLHVPFCRSRCHYCSFTSTAGASYLYHPYVAALKNELSRVAATNPPLIETVFIGGGTPTILPIELLIGIIDYCGELMEISADAEISVEANPGTVNGRSLQLLARSGVNRLSLGVQSFDTDDLKRLGRIHSAEEAEAAILAARRAGFKNLSLDLMCGLPYQTVSSWQRTLDRALSYSPEHLSVYQLTVEEETPLALDVSRGCVRFPDEEEIVEMDRRTVESCRTAGLIRYEISNYSRPGYACRHNINYWENGEYFACGASAVSYLAGVREKRIPDILEYIEKMAAGVPVIAESECLSAEASFRETVIMGLRMVRGVDRERLRLRYGLDLEEYYDEILRYLVERGMVELTATSLRLSERGILLANPVMAELV